MLHKKFLLPSLFLFLSLLLSLHGWDTNRWLCVEGNYFISQQQQEEEGEGEGEEWGGWGGKVGRGGSSSLIYDCRDVEKENSYNYKYSRERSSEMSKIINNNNHFMNRLTNNHNNHNNHNHVITGGKNGRKREEDQEGDKNNDDNDNNNEHDYYFDHERVLGLLVGAKSASTSLCTFPFSRKNPYRSKKYLHRCQLEQLASFLHSPGVVKKYILLLLFMRDPLSRTISSYKYFKVAEPGHVMHSIAVKNNFASFCEVNSDYLIRVLNPFNFGNCGREDDESDYLNCVLVRKRQKEHDLKRATDYLINNLERLFVMVGLVDHFSASVRLMYESIGTRTHFYPPFPNCTSLFPSPSPSTPELCVPEERNKRKFEWGGRRMVRGAMRAKNLTCPHLKEEYRLYEAVKTLFFRQLSIANISLSDYE